MLHVRRLRKQLKGCCEMSLTSPCPLNAGWKSDSVFASSSGDYWVTTAPDWKGELAPAGAAAVKLLKDKGLAAVEPLATLGLLRCYPKGQTTLGQIDAGAVAPGIALLLSKKSRGLMKDVASSSSSPSTGTSA